MGVKAKRTSKVLSEGQRGEDLYVYVISLISLGAYDEIAIEAFLS